jgi:hypothetical protein
MSVTIRSQDYSLRHCSITFLAEVQKITNNHIQDNLSPSRVLNSKPAENEVEMLPITLLKCWNSTLKQVTDISFRIIFYSSFKIMLSFYILESV